jgi:hypothetical protein
MQLNRERSGMASRRAGRRGTREARMRAACRTRMASAGQSIARGVRIQRALSVLLLIQTPSSCADSQSRATRSIVTKDAFVQNEAKLGKDGAYGQGGRVGAAQPRSEMCETKPIRGEETGVMEQWNGGIVGMAGRTRHSSLTPIAPNEPNLPLSVYPHHPTVPVSAFRAKRSQSTTF